MTGMTTIERTEPPLKADERTMLVAWLEYHRATLASKCEGLTDDQLRTRSIPPSALSLLGLVRHMAEVELNWFRFWLAGEKPNPRYADEEEWDVDDADVAEAFDYWRSECNHAREVLATFDSLDAVGADQPSDTDPQSGFSARWVVVHMIEEYARHNGHADLLRELIDGTTGD
jgi:uncharacterized damage-inducible protein DinB